MRRRTPAQFEAEAIRVHNGRYKYPGLKFVHSKKKIDIECPEHGIFQQNPQKHLLGQGCPKCKIKRMPQTQAQSRESFIAKAKKIWNDTFDYSRVEYVNNHAPVTIVCKKQNHVFRMLPSNHTHPRFPQGCRECSGRGRWTLERFLSEAWDVHEDTYSYDQIKEVTSSSKKLPIGCRQGHGTFMQSPAHHIQRKQGCPDCAGTKRGTTERFVEGARRVHGDMFSYNLVVYKTVHENVRIVCNSCNCVFEQLPSNHLRSKEPCPKCSGRSVDTSEFIRRAQEKHGDLYDYSESIYVNASSRLIIICPYHGPFEQLPPVHWSGSGCQKCRRSFGHEVIRSALSEAGVIFGEEYLLRYGGGMPLWFDFAILQDGACVGAIEFHGEQHYRPINFGSGKLSGDEQLELVKSRDQRKRVWCERNGVSLLEIRFDQIRDARAMAVTFALRISRERSHELPPFPRSAMPTDDGDASSPSITSLSGGRSRD
jgi:hypothetical protein